MPSATTLGAAKSAGSSAWAMAPRSAAASVPALVGPALFLVMALTLGRVATAPAHAHAAFGDASVDQRVEIARTERNVGWRRVAQANSSSQPAPASPPTDVASDSVGLVSSLQGSASVTRKGATTVLKAQAEVFKGDVLKTGPASALGIIFDDETTFSLTANATITIDEFVYQEGGGSNAASFSFAQGTVAFVANAVAKTGNMTMTTPTATMGIRGTTGLVDVGPNSAAAGQDAIKLYPDADGKVGRIEIKARDGTSLGVLTRPATGFSFQRGAGARVVATPLQISPQQAARDQNLVRQVHAERQRGQTLVAQRRAARPQGVGPRPGQKPNGAPPRPPGVQQKPPVQRGALPPRPPGAQQAPPAQGGTLPPRPPVVQQKPPVQRGALPPRPRLGAPPKGKPASKDKHAR
jgi:hypothetical protein